MRSPWSAVETEYRSLYFAFLWLEHSKEQIVPEDVDQPFPIFAHCGTARNQGIVKCYRTMILRNQGVVISITCVLDFIAGQGVLSQDSAFSKKSNPGALVLNERDNVGTLLNPAEPNAKILLKSVNGESSLVAKEHVDAGHKIALQNIRKGDRVVKFGETIGEATKDISVGSHVHSHNMRSLHGRSDKK